MSTSVFLDTLRQHDLEQSINIPFHSMLNNKLTTKGINQLQKLAELSVQDYAELGITNLANDEKYLV
ncbi:unnamed protein product [Cunninghamella blakesleeana]